MPKIPDFTDDREAADWFATHDTAPYIEDMEEVQEQIPVFRSRSVNEPEEKLRAEIRRRHIDKLFGTADRLAALDEPLSDAEVEAEIAAARQTRQLQENNQ